MEKIKACESLVAEIRRKQIEREARLAASLSHPATADHLARLERYYAKRAR